MGMKLKGNDPMNGATVEVDSSDFAALAKLKRVSISFDTPNLEQGIPVYDPVIGDWLYDLWIDVQTPFDTQALVDFTVAPVELGVYAATQFVESALALNAPQSTHGMGNDSRPVSGSMMAIQHQARMAPAKFLTSDPLKAYVSKDGKCDGTGQPIEATEGEVVVCVLVFPEV